MARKIVLKIAAAISAFIATPAFAADMPVKAPPPRAPVPVATTWTGCYVNAGAGYGFFSEEHHFSVPAAGTTGEDQTAGGRGWLGTVGGGCDYRVNSNFVVGVLADYDFMDLRGHIDGLAGAFTGTEKESSAVAVGGRIGYLVTPQILAYINGGWSSTRFDTVTFNASIGGAATGVTLPAHTFNGGFIGGGTEVAVQAVPGLYWRNEYRYATYGSADLQFSGLAGFSSHEARNVQTITTSLVWNSVAPMATPAAAAAMPVKALRGAPVPVATTWTGCYVNGGAGYGFFSQEHHFSVPAAGMTAEDQTAGGRGWLGLVGGGCDYQFNSSFVVGALADYDFMDLRGHFGELAGGLTGKEKESSAVAAGGRIGYLVTPQILAYINGGWSSTRFDGVTFDNTVGGTASGVTLPSHTFSGGFIGGGSEVAVQAVPNLYWRNEYRYATYGAADLQLSGAGAVSVFTHESKNVQTITTSLVWKFH